MFNRQANNRQKYAVCVHSVIFAVSWAIETKVTKTPPTCGLSLTFCAVILIRIHNEQKLTMHITQLTVTFP